MAVAPVDIRKARAFLRKRNIPSRVISPRRFAMTAAELSKTFSETLKLLAQLMMGGQGLGPAPIAQKIAEKEE